MNELEAYNVESNDDLAPTTARCYGPSGGYVPYRCAGYTYNGAAYCVECAAEIEVTDSDGETWKIDHFPDETWDEYGFGVGVLSGASETEYPGDSCDVCHRRLPTNILR
jgi:hypothetical protein